MKSIFIHNKNSLKLNYIYNVVRLASAAVVYLITTPYINRILGAFYVGKVEYVNAVINYFLLFSALGIPMYGIREIAKNRNNEVARARTVLELLIILTITSIVSYAVLWGIIFNTGYFTDYKPLLLIMSVMILMSNVGCEWYFQGIENHLYITIRYVVVRILVVFLIFNFVSNQEDYTIFAWSLVLIGCGANIFNLYYIFKLIIKNYADIIKDVKIKKHIKPVLTVFIATVSINIYLQMDYLLIEYLTSNEYVGYYSVANKLIRFVISFITVIGVVSLPRLTHFYHNDRFAYFALLKKTFNYLFILSLPTTIFFMIYAGFIVNIMGGKEFQESILTMRILSPLCVIVSFAYIMGFLVLYPQNKEIIYTYAVVFSAILSLVLNYFAITHYKQNGAALVGVFAEILAVFFMYRYARKNVMIPELIDLNFLKILISGLVMFFVSCLVVSFFQEFWCIIVGIICSFAVFFSVLYSVKESEVTQLVYLIKNKVQ